MAKIRTNVNITAFSKLSLIKTTPPKHLSYIFYTTDNKQSITYNWEISRISDKEICKI